MPHRETTSPALHLRNTSPTNSVVAVWASGKCQGLWKVLVRARCCSAITLRDIRYCFISMIADYEDWRIDRTERRIVFMNLSMSSGFMRSRHSSTPIASLGITVRCSCKVWLIFLQNLSLSSNVLISLTLRRLSKAL